MKTTAIILSAGKGKRMKTEISKQYLSVYDKPIIYYTISAFENSNVDDIVIVAGKDDIDYVKDEIVKKFNFNKVTSIVSGGTERYDSVICGLKVCLNSDYVLIHDGARPLIKSTEINYMIEEVQKDSACVAAMPVKDTIKIADDKGYVQTTPDRSHVWQIQTPQAFATELIKDAYDKMLLNGDKSITDDAMVVEKYTDVKVKLVKTSYENIKITTPEDLKIFKCLLNVCE